jgi:iron complex outermembrane receptor protein
MAGLQELLNIQSKKSGASTMNSTTALYMATGLTCALISGTVSAQSVSSSTPTPAAAPEGLEEIVVTALKRSSTLQETPISVAVVTGDGLRALGATSLPDYFRQVPNLNLTQGAAGMSRIGIRGISAAGEATVGLYYDETPITGPNTTTQDPGQGQADLNLFDVERVEVLRGPQGTLYGSSSMAGTLRVIFNKPNATTRESAFEAQATTTEGGTAGSFAKGMINQPIITDVLALRMSGYHETRPGYVDNIVLGRNNVNGLTSDGFRGLIGFTPRSDLTITGTAIYQSNTTADLEGWYQALGKYKTNTAAQLPFNSKLRLINLTGTWTPRGATITATGSYYSYDILRTADFTQSYVALETNPKTCRRYLALPTACTATQLASFGQDVQALLPIIGPQPASLEAASSEVRATSNTSGPFQWTVGGFYEHRRDNVDSNTALADPVTGQVFTPYQDRAYRYVITSITQKAEFADLSFTPFSKLTLDAGVRYYDYSKTTAGASLKGDILFNSFPTAYSQITSNATGLLKKFNISYHFTPGIFSYATASQGFRPGGANNIPTLPSGLVSYRPDSLWNYEVGLKSSWLDNTLIVDAALFQIDWSNVQTRATTADGIFSYITNAGNARSRGGEVEITGRPIAGLLLSGGFGFTDARLTQDQLNSNIQLTGTTGLKGDYLPGVPRLTGSASASYSFPLTSALNGLLRADYAYTGQMQSSFRPTTDPYFEKYGDYSSVNLRAGVESGPWGLYLFIQNLTDVVGITGAHSELGIKRQLFTIPPRTVGINGRMSF